MDNVLDLKVVKLFVDTCHQSWLKGWNERNGGNMSYRMKDEEVAQIRHLFDFGGEWRPIGLTVENLANEFFTVTGSGKYYKNVLREFPTHLLNHSIKKEKTNGAYRVIMHAHPANTIALTFLLPLEDKAFTREIWEMITECPIVFPAGIGVVPWMVCGSSDIAYATGEKIKQFDAVIWSHHGIFCCGQDFDVAFGLMDTIEKSAEILIKVMSCGGKKQFITREQILALAEPYNVPIDGNMLD